MESCKAVFGDNIAVFSNSAGLEEYDPDGRKGRAVEYVIGIRVIRHMEKLRLIQMMLWLLIMTLIMILMIPMIRFRIALSHDPTIVLAKAEANAEENKELAGKYEVQGFPTIKIFRSNGEKIQEYNGPREADGIVSYLKKQVGPASNEIFRGSRLVMPTNIASSPVVNDEFELESAARCRVYRSRTRNWKRNRCCKRDDAGSWYDSAASTRNANSWCK